MRTACAGVKGVDTLSLCENVPMLLTGAVPMLSREHYGEEITCGGGELGAHIHSTCGGKRAQYF